MKQLSDERIIKFAERPFNAEMGEIITMALELKERRALSLLAEAATKEKSGDYPEECELVAVDTGEGWALYAEKDGDIVAALKWNGTVYGDRQTARQFRDKGFRVE